MPWHNWKKYEDMTPEERRAKSRRSRRRRKRAKGSYTAEDIRLQYNKQDGLCYWCMEELSDKFHRDHYLPIAKGGTNYPDNIVLSCPHCNLSRGSKMPNGWTWRKVYAYWLFDYAHATKKRSPPRARKRTKRASETKKKG